MGAMRPSFEPQPVQHNRCAVCGTLRHAHATDGRCPDMYRPDTLQAAQAVLAAAVATGDPAAEFIARGDVQRLGGKP